VLSPDLLLSRGGPVENDPLGAAVEGGGDLQPPPDRVEIAGEGLLPFPWAAFMILRV